MEWAPEGTVRVEREEGHLRLKDLAEMEINWNEAKEIAKDRSTPWKLNAWCPQKNRRD